MDRTSWTCLMAKMLRLPDTRMSESGEQGKGSDISVERHCASLQMGRGTGAFARLVACANGSWVSDAGDDGAGRPTSSNESCLWKMEDPLERASRCDGLRCKSDARSDTPHFPHVRLMHRRPAPATQLVSLSRPAACLRPSMLAGPIRASATKMSLTLMSPQADCNTYTT